MDPTAAADLAARAAAVAAVATVVSALVALLLFLEARAARNVRLEANVAAYPTLHGEAGMYLTVIAENYGPAAATDVLVFMRLRTSRGDAIGRSERRMREPEWGPGHRRTFMPRREQERIESLNELAESDLVLELEWAWSDGRRLFWRIGRGAYVRQNRKATYQLRTFRDDMYGGQALLDPDPLTALPRIHADLKDINQSLDKVRRALDRRPARTKRSTAMDSTAEARPPSDGT